MTYRVAIWNPVSGSAPAERALNAALGDSTELVPTTADDPGVGQAQAAVEAGADIVIACGGDGTVRACLDPLAGSQTSLAILPTGTANLLAANLNVPRGLAGAGGIGQGEKRPIDLGRINGEAFAVMAGSGFDALMIRDANDRVKSRFGPLAYVLSGLKNLRAGLVRTHIEIDGEEWYEGRTSMVLVGNFGTVSGGIAVFPEARPDDGVLDVAIMSANTLSAWASVAWGLFRDKPPKLEVARRTTCRQITVSLSEPRPYQLDGDERPATSQLEITVEPAAISVHQQGR